MEDSGAVSVSNNRFHAYLLKTPIGYLISWVLAIKIVLGECFRIGGLTGQLSINEYHSYWHLLYTGIIGPLLETFIFQYAVINVLQRFRANNIIIIILSAGLFGIWHWYSIAYVLYAFIAGLIYSACFILFQQRKNKAFPWVFILHSSYNIYALLTIFVPYWLDPHRKPLNWNWDMLAF